MLSEVIAEHQLTYLTEGFQSDVYLSQDGQRVVKVIGLRPSDAMTKKQAETLSIQISQYHHSCRQANLRVPANLGCWFGFDQKINRWLIFELESYAGVSANSWLIKNDEVDPNQMIGQIIDQLLVVFATVNLAGFTQIGLDPKTANFAIDSNQVITYIDFVPPRYRYNGDFLIEYLQPMSPEEKSFFINRYFTKLGIVKIFLVQLSRILPQLRHSVIKLLGEHLAQKGEFDLIDQIHQLPSLQFHRHSDVSLIDQINPADPDSIRDLACEVAVTNGHLDRDSFQRIFNLTHLDVRKGFIIPEDHLGKIKQLLADMVSGA